MPQEMDGQLFVLDQAPPAPPSHAEVSTETVDDYFPYRVDPSQTRIDSTLYERVLLKTKDPTSLPHTRKKCVKWGHAGPITTCIGWKIEYRWIYVTAVLRVTTSVDVNIGDAVEDCLLEGGVAAALAVLVTGGTTAVAAAEAAFKACLVRKLGEKLLTVSINLHHNRGDWE